MTPRYHATGLAILLLSATLQAQWTPVGTANFSPGITDNNTMDIGPDDRPVVAYTDWNNSFKVTAMRYTGSDWQTWGNAGFSDGSVMALTLKINSAGVPYVAYRDLSNSLRITVMRLNGDTWQRVGSSGPSTDAGHFPSLAFDAADVPYIAFRDEAHSMYLTVKRFVGDAWESVGTEGFSDITASVTDLCFTSTGIPYVAIDGSSSGSRVYRLAGDTWEQAGTIASLYDCRIAAMGLDGQDVPYIAYFDVGDSFHAKVKQLVGDTWTAVGGPVSIDDESPEAIAMAVHDDGTVHVVFADNDLVMRLTARKFANDAWTTLGGTGFTAILASNITMATDGNGVPHVGFKDMASGVGKATVLRYQEGASSVGELADATPHLLPNPAHDQVTLTGLPARAQVTLYDPTGKTVRTAASTSDTHTIDTSTLQPGIYVVQVRSTDVNRCLRLVIAH